MPSPRAQRQREHDRRTAEVAAREEAAAAYRNTQRGYAMAGAAVVVLIIGSVAYAGVKSRSSTSVAATGQSTTSSTSTTVAGDKPTNTAPPITVTPIAAGERITGDTPCPRIDGSERRVTSFEKAPPQCFPADQGYDVVIKTTKGDIKGTIGNPEAAEIVNNFLVLASYHYYDGMPVDFARERGWWEAGTKVEGVGGIVSPGYSVPYTGPEQIMTSIQLAMALDPAGSKNVTSRLIVGFGEFSNEIPAGTPTIGIILDGVDASQGVGKSGTASGAVTELNTILSITITEGQKITKSGGSSTTTVPSSAPGEPTPTTPSS